MKHSNGVHALTFQMIMINFKNSFILTTIKNDYSTLHGGNQGIDRQKNEVYRIF
jgi:4-diphosphocytidyl-2C-methyl-D-erythritol kinase